MGLLLPINKRMGQINFTLPKYQSAIMKLVGEIKLGLENSDPILSQIQHVQVTHHGKTRQVSEPQILETPMREYSVGSTIEVEWICKTNVSRFCDSFYQLFDVFISDMKRTLFETVSNVSEVTGNVFDSSGRDFWDSYLDMIKGVEMTFDEDGKHDSALYLNPETAKRINENPPTPQQTKLIEEAINRKREEYYATKRTRRLS